MRFMTDLGMRSLTSRTTPNSASYYVFHGSQLPPSMVLLIRRDDYQISLGWVVAVTLVLQTMSLPDSAQALIALPQVLRALSEIIVLNGSLALALGVYLVAGTIESLG